MGTEYQDFFARTFEQLTRREPYPWQTALFSEIAEGRWPQVVNMPTGTGKTAIVHIWLVALAWSIIRKQDTVPRRLAWVVNRRVVVDQVTDEAEALGL